MKSNTTASSTFAVLLLRLVLGTLCLLVLVSGCGDRPPADDDDLGDDDTADDDDLGDDDTSQDSDGDGWTALDDCDDSDVDVHPEATELCDGIDNDCDGTVATFELDTDGDGHKDCDALLWAVSVISYSFYADLVDNLQTVVREQSTATCPLEENTSQSRTVTSRDEVTVTTDEAVATFSGPCNHDAGNAEGSAAFSEYSTAYQPTAPAWSGSLSGQDLVADDFALHWDEAGAEPGWMTLDGSVAMTSDAIDTDDGVQAGDEWGAVEINLLVGSNNAPTALPKHLRDTQTQLDLTVTHTLITCQGGGEESCDREEETFTATGSTTANPASQPWHAVADLLSWSYAFGIDEDTGEFAKTGCYLEPASGSITVEARESPDGPVTWLGSIAYDGETDCDSCGLVSINGESVGPWCGLAPLEEPTDEVP